MFNFRHFFSISFRVWFYTLLLVNLITLVLLNATIDHQNNNYSISYAVMVINVLLNYLLIAFFQWGIPKFNQSSDPNIEPAGETEPFHQWVWHTDNLWLKALMVSCLFIWTIPNIILCFNISGIGYLMMIFFVLSLSYWLMVGGGIAYSYYQYQPVVRV